MTSANPIKMLREARGLSRQQLALALDVDYNRVAAIEAGASKKLPPAWRCGLESIGEDFGALAAAYGAWRTAQVIRVRAEA